MLTYEEFKEAIRNEILDYMPAEYGEVSIENVIKNNDSVNDGLLIKRANECISPTIYLRQFYSEYYQGSSIEAICRRIADIRLKTEVKQTFDAQLLLDFDFVKSHIRPALVNKKQNSKLLLNRPHRELMDLAVTYYVDLSNISMGINKNGAMSMAITYEIMEKYGCSEEDLYEISTGNLSLDKPVINYIHDYLYGMLYDKAMQNEISEEDFDRLIETSEFERSYEIMYLTNEKKFRGSSLILDSEALKVVAEKIGGDYFILPSSIHELIMVKSGCRMNVTELHDMVIDINSSSVAVEDFLSNSVYYYSRDTHELSLAIA